MDQLARTRIGGDKEKKEKIAGVFSWNHISFHAGRGHSVEDNETRSMLVPLIAVVSFLR